MCKCVKRSDPRYTLGILDVTRRLWKTFWRQMTMSVENEALLWGIGRCGRCVSVAPPWCDWISWFDCGRRGSSVADIRLFGLRNLTACCVH